MLRGVLFDMDGVLVDSEPVFLKNMERFLQSMGHTLTQQELLTIVGKTSVNIATDFIAQFELDMEIHEFLEKQKELNGNLYESPDLVLFDGVMECLKWLREQKIKTALVSSTSAASVLSATNRFQLTGLFDAIVCRDMVVQPKPSPIPYQTAMKLLGLEATSCVVVEDSPIGIASADAAGVDVVGFSASYIEQALPPTRYRANGYQELRKIIATQLQLCK